MLESVNTRPPWHEYRAIVHNSIDWANEVLKMKTTMAIMMALSAALATAGDFVEADYEEFAETGVLDPDLYTMKANELVWRGISSGQPRIVELTVRAMGKEAFERALHLPVVARHFSLVPGLKEFLVGYWRDNIDGFARGAEFVPLILAVHYPGDEDAYRVTWEYQANGGPAFGTLLALNAGGFKTPEADDLRIDSLSSDDYVTFASEALGIAMSTPRGGIEAVVSALKSNPLSADMPTTRMAILAYGPEAVPVLLEGLEKADLSPKAESVVTKALREIEDRWEPVRRATVGEGRSVVVPK